MKAISFLIILLLLNCENLFYRKKNRFFSKDAGDTAYFYGVVLGCFNWKAPDYCSQKNSIILNRTEDKKCGLSFASIDPYIYNEFGTQIRTESITGIQKLQCKSINESSLQSGSYRWYKINSVSANSASLVFTHTKINSMNVDFFSDYNVGDMLLCCREVYINQISCKESYWEIWCNQIKIM
ncbi:MAG TPA: hypothetical protein PL163_25605 [Leptospiraceae bacterium]|nr:hypothetical protein [Leptospiraceae bacterium]